MDKPIFVAALVGFSQLDANFMGGTYLNESQNNLQMFVLLILRLLFT